MKRLPKKDQFVGLFFQKHVLRWIGLLFVILFFVLPIIRLIFLSLTSQHGFSFESYRSILQDHQTWDVLKNTIYVVCGSTILAVILGVFMSWMVAYSDLQHKNLVQLFVLLPFIIPSYIVTLSWTQFFSGNSMVTKLIEHLPGASSIINIYSFGGIIFVMGLSHYPLVYLLTVGILRRIPRDLEVASRLSGASRLKTFINITLPMALPGIASGGLLAFLAGLDNFGIPAFLGIPANISVLSTYIYQQIVGFGPSAFEKAATLSVLLGLIALLGTLLQWLLIRNSNALETANEDRLPRFSLGKYRSLTEIIIWIFLIGMSIVPLFSMVMTSLLKAYGVPLKLKNLTLKHYHFILFESDKVIVSIKNSLILAGTTMVICLILGTIVAYFRVRKPSIWTKASEIIIGLPYALPGIVLALAMIFMWMEPIPGWNPGIYGTIVILFFAYLTRFLILQVRGSITALLQVDPSMEEAAHVSGANNWSKWRSILIPLLLPGLLSGAFLIFLQSLTELTVSSILYSAGTETIGVVILNFEQAGYSTYSTAFSTLIVCLIALGIILLFYLNKISKVR